MGFLSIRESPKDPKSLKLAFGRFMNGRKAVTTNSGKPRDLVFKISASNFESTLSLPQQLEFTQAIADMRGKSARSGNPDMSLDEINAVIDAARKDMQMLDSRICRS